MTETIGVAFSPTGRRLAALGADNRLYVWDFNAGNALRAIAVNVVPSRASIGHAFRPPERGTALAWWTDDSLALVTGAGRVTVLPLDSEKWNRRIEFHARP